MVRVRVRVRDRVGVRVRVTLVSSISLAAIEKFLPKLLEKWPAS